MQQSNGPVVIDVGSVMARKLGERRMRRVPRFVVGWLERLIRQRELNELLRRNYPATGADFCAGVLRDLGVGYTVTHAERLPAAESSDARVVFVANHPLGGLDGMILIDMLTRRCCRPDEKLSFVVNDLLMAVEPLRDVFVPVNKHGRQGRDTVSAVEQAFASDAPVVMFPAGLCSRRGADGLVRDLKWNPMFVRRALKEHRDVIPLRVVGENSPTFYRFANWRKRLGLKLNIEMVRLPAELVGARGRSFEVVVGERIACSELAAMGSPAEAAARVREMIYEL